MKKKKVITDDSDEAEEEEGGSKISDSEQKMSRIAQSVKGKDRRVRTPKKFDDDLLDSGDQPRSRPQRSSQKTQTPIKTNRRSAKRTSRVITDSSTSSSSDGDDISASSSSDESASSASVSNSSDSSSDESASISVSSGSSSASESESESGNESDSDDESTAPQRRGKNVQSGKRAVTNKGKIQAKMKKQPQQKNLSPQATPKRNLRNLPKKKYSKDYEYEYDDDEEEEEMSEEDSDEISLGSEDTDTEESPSQSSSDGGDDDNAYDDEEEYPNNGKNKNKSKSNSEDDEIEPPSLSTSSSDNESNHEEEEDDEDSSESNSDDSEEEDDDDDDDEDSDDNYGEKSRKRKTPVKGRGRTNRVQNTKGRSSRVSSGSSQKKGKRAKQKDPVSNFIIPPQHYTEIPLKLEKALAWKYADTRNEEDEDDDYDIEDEEMLIFVKWKDISYQHCEWVFKSAFDEDKLSRQRINLMIKRRNGCFAYPPLPAGGENPSVAALAEEDDGHVAPEVLEPERILLSYRVTREEDEKVHAIVQTKLSQRELKKEQKRLREQEQKGEASEEKSDATVKDEDNDSDTLNDSENESMFVEDEDIENVPLYLVKWKGLGYVNATWETRRDLAIAVGVSEANDLIHEYWERSKVPPASTWKEPPSPKVRGKGRAWKAITEVPEGFFGPGNTLRPYQLEGLNWLVYCWRNSTNSILADEMGLGKTAQTVATMQWLHAREGVRGPFLVIAPLSTLGHWKREAENWTQLRTIVYHGSAQEKNIIRACEWAYPANPNGPPYKFDLLITTYETIRSDRALLCGVKWAYAAFDEAHRLKNSASKVLADVKALQLEQILLLTGTPIQNDTSELWTLLNLLDPVEFASRDDFMAEFGELRDATQVSALHDILKPYLLRRMKENVEATLSAKEETLIEVELTVLQKQYYRAIYEHNIAFLRKGCKGSAAPSLINVVMELRKCCNHPYLIKGVEQAATAGLKDEASIHRQLVAASGKLVLIDKLLPKLKADGHQVLIFSQMVRVLDILEDYLSFCGYQFERLDGRIRGSDRQAAIDRFCKPGSDRFVFLLCTRAGGLGINLQVADTVIIFDSDWNPQNDVQAQARCHRIGQKKDVKVYRLITHGTYEKYMFDTASRKLGLDQAVLTKFEQSTSPFRDADSAATSPSPVSGDAQGLVPQAGGITLRQMSTKQIDSLLKHGAYGIMESDDAAKKFVEADIDQILQGATTIVHNSEGGGSGGSTFSKASFVSDQSAPDIDIDDPDFWEKLMPEVETRNPLIMTEPRERHPVDHFSLTQVDMDDSSSSDDDGEEETDDTSATAAAAAEDDDKPGAAGHKVKKIRHWNAAEKQRFRTWLVYLGWGRWARLKESAKLTKWSEEEVESFAKAFLCKLLACIEDKDKRGKYVASVTCLNPADIEGWDSEDFVLRSEHLDAAPELHLPDYINDTVTLSAVGSTPTESPVPVPAETNGEEVPQQSPAPSEMFVEEVNEAKQEPTTPITEQLIDTNSENKVSPSKPVSQDGTKSLKLRFVFPKTEEENNTSDTTTINTPTQQEQQLPLTHESEKEESASDTQNTAQKPQDELQQPLSEIKVEGDELEEKPEANKFLNVRRFDDEEELNSDSFNEYAKKNALKLLSRLSLGSQLNRIVERSPNRDFLTGLPDINDRICKWWTSQDDTDIIVGSVKWGLSRYDQIRSDPELRFLNDFGPPTPAASHTPEDDDEEKQPTELNPNEDELQSAGNDDKKDDMEVENQPAQTSQKEDEEIGETKDDGSTVSSSNSEDGKHVWPSNRELTKYIKRLYRHILNCEKIRLRQQAKAEKKAKQQEERDKKKALINAEWSKRERTDLVRILSTFGIPVDENGETDIELLRERARLSKKTSENVRSFLNTFLSRCDQVIQDTIAASKAQVDAAAAKTAKMTISFVENAAATTSPSSSPTSSEPNSLAEKQPEGADQTSEQKPAEAQEVKGEGEGAKEEEQQDMAPIQQATKEEQEAVTQLTKDIGYATCKRVIQRINLFKDLRKYLLSLSEDDLGIVLASSKRSQAMPKWWDPKVHDVSLIKGVVKHGFSKWDDIIEDPELSFYPIMVEYREKKKLDQKASTKNEEGKSDVVPEERHKVDIKKEDQQVTGEKVDDDSEKKADNANEEGEKKAENANEEGGEGEKKPDITLAQLIGLPRDIQLLHRLEGLITLGKQAEDIILKANEKKAKKSRGSKSSAKTKRVTKKSSTETGEAPDGVADKKKTAKKQRRKKVSEKDKLLNDAKSMGGLITGTTEEKEDGKEGEGESTKPSTKRSRRKKSVNTGDEDGEYVAKKTSHSDQSGDKSAAPKRRSSRKRKSVEHYSDESGSEKPPRAKSSETQEKRRREPKSRAKERTKKESSTATTDENGQKLQLPPLPEQPAEGDEISKQAQELAPPPAKKPRKKRTPKPKPKPEPEHIDTLLPSVDMLLKEDDQQQQQQQPQKQKRHRRTKAEMEKFRSELEKEKAEKASNPEPKQKKPRKPREKKERPEGGEGEKPPRKKKNTSNASEFPDTLDITGMPGTGYQQLSSVLTNQIEPPSVSGEPTVISADNQQFSLPFDIMGKEMVSPLLQQPSTSSSSSHGHHHHRTLDKNGQPVKHKHHKKHSERHSERHSEKKRKKKDDDIIDPTAISLEIKPSGQPFILGIQPQTNSSMVTGPSSINILPYGKQDIVPQQQSLQIQTPENGAGLFIPGKGYNNGAISNVAVGREHEKEPRKKERGRRTETRITEFGNPIFAPFFYKNVVVYSDGFKSERMHQSYKDPKTKCRYFMSIKAENSRPTFTVSCEDDPGNAFKSSNISECFDALNNSLMEASKMNGCAPKIISKSRYEDFFGLTSKEVIEHNNKAAMAQKSADNPNLLEYMKSLHHYHQRCNGKTSKTKQHSAKQEVQVQQEPQNVPRKLPSIQMYIPFAQQQSQIKTQPLPYPTQNPVMPPQFPPPPPLPPPPPVQQHPSALVPTPAQARPLQVKVHSFGQQQQQLPPQIQHRFPQMQPPFMYNNQSQTTHPHFLPPLKQALTQQYVQNGQQMFLSPTLRQPQPLQQLRQQQQQQPQYQAPIHQNTQICPPSQTLNILPPINILTQQQPQQQNVQLPDSQTIWDFNRPV